MNYDGGLTCALSVSDIEKSIGWYRDRLGFEMLYLNQEIGWCELKTHIAGVNVGLSQVENVPKGGGATLTFGVRDIDAERSSLEREGVRFDGETMTIPGMVRLATFFDPDGNSLMLYQDLAHE
jgi:predicted enzyme related to lactoylglutathione lyase